MRASPFAFLLLVWAVTGRAEEPAGRYEPRKDTARVPRQPYERYFTTDRFDREITFYLSETDNAEGPLPLVVYVHGSGCTSHFNRDGERVVPRNGHISVRDVCRGKARVLIVEKPGVAYLDQPRSAEELAGGPEFRREHTLERWAEAVGAGLRAARKLPAIDRDKALIVGHSEGGLVACRVARELPGVVTHVAPMAGGGPSQLFDLLTLARKGNFFRRVSEDPEERVRYLLDQWSAIRADPTNAEKLFFGHAYRRWATFLASSPMEELAATRAKVYIAQGAADDAVDPASADALYAHLRAKGIEAVYDRVEGADHSFHREAEPDVNGWEMQMTRIVNWFLGGER